MNVFPEFNSADVEGGEEERPNWIAGFWEGKGKVRIRPNRGVRCRAVCENLPCKKLLHRKNKDPLSFGEDYLSLEEFLKAFQKRTGFLKKYSNIPVYVSMVGKIYLWWSIVRLFPSRFLINVAPPPFSGQDSFFSFFSSLLSAPRRFSIHPRFVVLASAGKGRDEERRRSKLGIDRLLIGFIGGIIWEVFNVFFGCTQHYVFCLISTTQTFPKLTMR